MAPAGPKFEGHPLERPTDEVPELVRKPSQPNSLDEFEFPHLFLHSRNPSLSAFLPRLSFDASGQADLGDLPRGYSIVDPQGEIRRPSEADPFWSYIHRNSMLRPRQSSEFFQQDGLPVPRPSLSKEGVLPSIRRNTSSDDTKGLDFNYVFLPQKRDRESLVKEPGSPSSPAVNAENLDDKKKLVPVREVGPHADDGRALVGATKVDQLMLVIQARNKGVSKAIPRTVDGTVLEESDSQSVVPSALELVGGIERPHSQAMKNYQCQYCSKKFTQSTHLEVHVRSHIGLKPYECSFCGKRFTQGGNLRTHSRLHTGEKPFGCDVCSKRFSRKGNLQAHKLTHENLKPFECKLDSCFKRFTQLGNLKSHQNRFHKATLNNLTNKLADLSSEEEDIAAAINRLPTQEKLLLQYFTQLYKNSNRGIRGRGRTAKVTSPKKITQVPMPPDFQAPQAPQAPVLQPPPMQPPQMQPPQMLASQVPESPVQVPHYHVPPRTPQVPAGQPPLQNPPWARQWE